MVQYKGGSGTLKEQAIIIIGAENELEGVDAEYDYLDNNFGEYEFISQEFIGETEKQYDLLRIKLPDGTEREVWFDISGFYGRE
ncbi:MAG TPA: hypothetical protein VK870_04685 [Ignavibacteriaceae bacterium]|nr:hypothetical protein [Ignavibacteriaceae bacterium]